MRFEIFQPPAHLSPFIRHFWVMETNQGHWTHRCMASPGAEMLFHFKGRFDRVAKGVETCFVSGIQGQSTGHQEFYTEAAIGLFGIVFRPEGLYRLFGIDLMEIESRFPDLHTLLGTVASEWEERMALAGSDQERLSIICRLLDTIVAKSRDLKPGTAETIRYLIAHKGRLPVSALADFHCLSRRQLERNFLLATGFSPKVFSNVIRFRSAIADFGTGKSLTGIALDHGYYDQSHFIREFRKGSGWHPSKFAASAELPNRSFG